MEDQPHQTTQGEELTSRRCEAEFAITRDTANRDFSFLMKLGLVRKEGKGRSTRYVLGKQNVIVRESSDEIP